MAFLLMLVGMVVVGGVVWQPDWRELPLLMSETEPGTQISAPYVTNDVVNLRSGPATSFEILDVLQVETPVTVTGAARQGFLPVAVNGQRAWIAADYLTPAGSGRTLAAVTDVSEEVMARSGLVETVSAAPARPEADGSEPKPAHETVAAEVVAEPPVDVVEAAAVPSGEKWIEVDRTTALVTLHHGDTVVATYQGKIGRDPSTDGYYATAVGTFHVFSMNRELTETPFVGGVFLTDWVGFDPERSNGFHSPVRDAAGNVVNTQGTTTLGCVRLEEQAARDLYDFAHIGMRVEVHD